jgi:hypothetical protein
VRDKGKGVETTSKSSKVSSEFVSSRLHIKNDFSHVIGTVHPEGSNHLKAATEISKGDSSEKRSNASHSKYDF